MVRLQWMTAGRGIIHSEMPESSGDELLHGFQLWVNLPAKDKMCKPRYQVGGGGAVPGQASARAITLASVVSALQSRFAPAATALLSHAATHAMLSHRCLPCPHRTTKLATSRPWSSAAARV